MQTHKSIKPFQETKAMTLLHKGRCTLIELWYTQVKPCSRSEEHTSELQSP